MHRNRLMTAAWTVTLLFAWGCAQENAESPAPSASDAAEHRHAGWWCDEHGVPEEACALCDSRLVADFKAKGDWCQQHQRPDSQCFVCHPERAGEFAAEYEAKFGKQPPRPQEAGEPAPPAGSTSRS